MDQPALVVPPNSMYLVLLPSKLILPPTCAPIEPLPPKLNPSTYCFILSAFIASLSTYIYTSNLLKSVGRTEPPTPPPTSS